MQFYDSIKNYWFCGHHVPFPTPWAPMSDTQNIISVVSSTALPCPAQSQPSAANAVLALAALILQRENKQLLLGPECRIYTPLEMPQKWGVSLNK